jgi:protein-disulfide isomerase
MHLALRWAIAALMLWAGPAAAVDIDTALKERVLGLDSAQVTVIEYASLTCPHCARFHSASLPEFKARYLDTGKARLVFRDLPLDGLALRSAALARCLPEAAYFEFIAAAFDTQASWVAKPRLQAFDAVLALAARHAPDTPALEACASDEVLLDGIVRMKQEGEQKYGVDSTPSFVINGRSYAGALSPAELARIIDPLLASR